MRDRDIPEALRTFGDLAHAAAARIERLEDERDAARREVERLYRERPARAVPEAEPVSEGMTP
jgi:hypothetical protein